jgi:hypothetical protein
VEELEEALGPRLPLIEQVVERAIAESPAYSSEPPQRPGAYLLARWGTGHYRERGIEVLNNLAATDGPFYQALDAIRFLHS